MRIDPLPLLRQPRPATTGRDTGCDTVLLDVAPVLGLASGGCVIASGVAVCAFLRIGSVTQKTLAARCGVSWPLTEGMRLATLGEGLRHYGIATRSVGCLSLAMIRAALERGMPVIGGHSVDASKTVGHAVVICGWISQPARTLLVVADCNIAFPVLVDAATMIGSANDALLVDGVRR